MKIITINVPEWQVELFDRIAENDEMVPSRSEAIRQLINIGFAEWCKTLDLMRDVEKITRLRQKNQSDQTTIKVPNFGEYFEDGTKIKTYKVVRRLE